MKGMDVDPASHKEESKSVALTLPPVGLNDNLDFMGRQLHVQTEYIESPIARISTQVFCGGRVMLSKKTDCPTGIREARDVQKLQQSMNAQHQQIIREISDKQARILRSR